MSLRAVLPRCGDWEWLAPALPLAPLAPLLLCLALLDSQARTPGVWLAILFGGFSCGLPYVFGDSGEVGFVGHELRKCVRRVEQVLGELCGKAG